MDLNLLLKNPEAFGLTLAGSILFTLTFYIFYERIEARKTEIQALDKKVDNMKIEQEKRCQEHKTDAQSTFKRIEEHLLRIETLLIQHLGRHEQ